MKLYRWETEGQGDHNGKGIIIAESEDVARKILEEYISKLDKRYYTEYPVSGISFPIEIETLVEIPLEFRNLVEFSDGLCC